MTTSTSALRWTLKKVSRHAAAYGSRLLFRTPIPGRATRATVRTLTYHRFGHATRDPFCLAPEDFAAQMRYIARAGLAISLAQMETYLANKGMVPHDAVLVTVDDGFRSLRTHALPILAENAIPAVAFVSAGLTAMKRRDVRGDALPEDYLDWDDLEALVAAGVSVQSHGWSHRSLARLPRAEAQEELSRSREMLQSRLGTHVAAFAYPFGTRADFSSEIAVAVRETGYRLAFTSQHGPIRPGDPPFTLPRTKVESGENLSMFASLVHGGLDAWRWVDRGLWYLQSSRSPRAPQLPSGRAEDSGKPA